MASIRIVNLGAGDSCLKIDFENGVEISVAFDRGDDRTRTPSDLRIFNSKDVTEEIYGLDLDTGCYVPVNGFETILEAYRKCCEISKKS